MAEKLHVVRNQKDTVFRMLFREKKELLELYNALNDSAYNSPEDLTICTLENAIYMNFKNDISFLLDSEMNLYEHQGSYNPNMPLRDLVYIAKQLEKYTRDETIYSSTLVKIPVPRFVVFYNGTDGQPERQILWLSDAFENEKFSGKVTNISLEGTSSNGVTYYPVTVTLDEVGGLLPGMNVDGVIIVDSVENALAVPADALQRGNLVYVKDDSVTEAQGRVPAGFREVKVGTGLISSDYVEIVSGDLQEGDVVYVAKSSVNSDSGAMMMMPVGMDMPSGGGGYGDGGGSRGSGNGSRPGP